MIVRLTYTDVSYGVPDTGDTGETSYIGRYALSRARRMIEREVGKQVVVYDLRYRTDKISVEPEALLKIGTIVD